MRRPTAKQRVRFASSVMVALDPLYADHTIWIEISKARAVGVIDAMTASGVGVHLREKDGAVWIEPSAETTR